MNEWAARLLSVLPDRLNNGGLPFSLKANYVENLDQFIQEVSTDEF